MDKQKTAQRSDAELKRWFSTGFLASGVGKVNAEQHALEDAAVIRAGEAKGHDLWIDKDFCSAVALAAGASADKGIKARFGHPDMCADALGTFLGRWKGLRADADGVVRGTLHLSSTAAESPKGDLRNYVEQMAAKEPGHFGTSIVFSRDWEAEDKFELANIVETDETDNTGKPTGNKLRMFKSPDPANVKNLRHARLSQLHAADLVDDPAATDGMFSGAAGAALAARVSEYLDTHPEIIAALRDEPEMISILERYATELRPFMERYQANHPAPTAEPVQAAKPVTTTPAEPDPALTAKIVELETLIQTGKGEIQRLTGELAGTVKRADTAEAQLITLTAERDELVKRKTQLKADCETLERKLAAIEAGAPPVSAVAAPTETLTPWQKAQRARPSCKK